MLYKPTNPSPYNSVVDQPTESSPLTFTASCVSTSSITGMRLAIKDNTTEYYLPVADDSVSQCKTTSGIAIPYQSATFNSKESCSIKTSNFTRTDGLSNEVISKIVQPLTSYRWQVRLYQGSVDINIAYGFVQDVINFNNSSKPNRRILKVRPHTNMFMGKSQRDEAFGDNYKPVYNLGWSKNLTEYYDGSVAYQIQFDGKAYDIKNYYYSKAPAYYTSSTKVDELTVEKQYDEPLFAYIEIDIDDGDTIETGAEYTILTNYIDSNEYYFSCRQLSEVKFRGRDDNPINEFTSIDELDANPEDHIYSPTHSNVQIKGSFDSKSGATINYYKVTLYQVLSNGEDIQIHDSGYVYDSAIDYDCKDLLSGNTYKLVIAITDTYGNTVSKGVYIEPDCGAIVKPTSLSIEPYHAHNSIVIDFGKVLSMTGVESNPHTDSYKIYSLKGDWDGDLEQYTDIADTNAVTLMDAESTTNHIDVKACYIAPDNTVTFSKIDGTDKTMMCKNPLVNMTFRCRHGDIQTIYELQVGNYVYRFTWEVYRFHMWIGRYVTRRIIKDYTYEDTGSGIVAHPVYETVTYLYKYSEAYYSPYDTTDQSDIQSSLAKNETDYSVPYLAYEELDTGKDQTDLDGEFVYTHTESAAHDFWWQIIFGGGAAWYMKCLNSGEYNWEIRDRIIAISTPHQTDDEVAKLDLFGGCSYCNISIENYDETISPKHISDFKENPLRDLVWSENTVFQANFSSGKLVGGNFDGGFASSQYADVHHYRIYKTLSEQPGLHLIYETNNAKETIIEDFSVGSKCNYTYYIVPVCYNIDIIDEEDKEGAVETLGSVIKSEPIMLNDGTIRVIGLIQDDKDLDTYYIDTNNVWNFSLNVSNAGFNTNMGKTYNDTPQKYPIEVKNKGFYRTFNIRGLLGRFDCGTMKYVDTYDDIIEWENFVGNGEMKLVIDLRGIQTIGTMESNSVDYNENGANLVYANFSIKQLEDINKVTILNRKLWFNPADGTLLLKDVDNLALQDSEDKYFLVEGGE